MSCPFWGSLASDFFSLLDVNELIWTVLDWLQAGPNDVTAEEVAAADVSMAETTEAETAETAETTETTQVATPETAETVSKKAAPSEIDGLLRKLKKLVGAAEKGLAAADEGVGASSAKFLTFVFANHKKFANYLPVAMRISVWNAYRSSVLPSRWQDRLVENLVSSAREKELLPMVNAILQDLQNVSNRIG